MRDVQSRGMVSNTKTEREAMSDDDLLKRAAAGEVVGDGARQIELLVGLLDECWSSVYDDVYGLHPNKKPLLERMDFVIDRKRGET